jgi:holo-[acyl-carrier protein] synthase
MVLRTGIDLLEIHRMHTALLRFGPRFLERVFTPVEIAEVGNNPASLAARFAAKEAVAKALGTGIGVVSWKEIEIQRGSLGEPILYLYGSALRLSHEIGLSSWSLSLSHTQSLAIASVVAIG